MPTFKPFRLNDGYARTLPRIRVGDDIRMPRRQRVFNTVSSTVILRVVALNPMMVLPIALHRYLGGPNARIHTRVLRSESPYRQLDLAGGRRDRDEGLATVARPWRERAIEVLEKHRRPGVEVHSDEVRLIVEDEIGKPHTDKGWGGLFNSAKFRNIIIDTGREASSKIRSNHARKVTIYRWGQ